MAINQSGNSKTTRSSNDDEPINVRALLFNYVSYWPLILVSLAIALVIAVFYNKYSTPSYEIRATLLIKDSNEKPPEEKSSLVEFQELEQVNAPKVVENEIEVLKSNQLIRDVVDKFQLWADYKLKGGIIKDRDLYGISPVKINLYKTEVAVPQRKLVVQVLDSGTYLLLGAKEKANRHHFGDTIAGAAGAWGITANSNISRYRGNIIEINVSDPEGTILGYQNALNVETQEKPATIINVSINDQNVRRGEDFINYLIYSYQRREIEEKSTITKNTLDFIDNRLDSLSGQLNHAENNIEGYRSKNGLTDINSQSQIYLQEIQASNEKLNDVNTQLNIIDKLEAYLNQPGNSANVPSTMGITDQHLTDLVQKLTEEQLERNKLLASLPEKNPAFEPIDNQIATLKTAIRDNVKSIKASLLTTQQSLNSFRSGFQSSVKNVPVQEHQLAGMGRQQSTKASLYDYLLQQREAISLTYASAASNVQLVDSAHTMPVKSSKKLIPFAAAFLIGLIFPAGFIYGRDLLRHTVTNRHEIERITGVPVIAEFSMIKLPSALVLENRDTKDSFVLIEQFRRLRTRLAMETPHRAGGLFTLVTSSVGDEGKTFISANLAVALASSGRKIILVEADIYHPSVGRTFNLPLSAGLTDYLSGQTSRQQIIQKSAIHNNLDVIAVGSFADNFSELLNQEAFKNLLDELRDEYEYILFDTPPVHSISDAYIIAGYCDVTLYMVRYDHTSKTLLPFIHKIAADGELPKMNIVFNGLTGGRDGDGYKYESYYHETPVKHMPVPGKLLKGLQKIKQ